MNKMKVKSKILMIAYLQKYLKDLRIDTKIVAILMITLIH